jgi:hypothetical protein
LRDPEKAVYGIGDILAILLRWACDTAVDLTAKLVIVDCVWAGFVIRVCRNEQESGMRRMKVGVLLVAILLSVSGCVCRPGHIGPYGGLHPGACYF